MLYYIMLCHAKTEMIAASLENFQLTRMGIGKLVMVDQYYPLVDKAENSAKLRALAFKHDALLLDHCFGMSIGCRAGLNYALKTIKIQPHDTWIIYDPDSRPTTRGWDLALNKVCSDKYPAVSIMSEAIEHEIYERGFTEEKEGGFRLLVPNDPCTMSVVAFATGPIDELGGYQDFGGLYGGLEAKLVPKIFASGRKVAYLADFWTVFWAPSRRLVDPIYTEWKRAHALTNTFPGSFDEYVALREKK